MHSDSFRANILGIVKRPTDYITDNVGTGERISILISLIQKKKFCLNLHYIENNSYLYVNGA